MYTSQVAVPPSKNAHDNHKPRIFNHLQTLRHPRKTQVLSFQQNTNSFNKTPGVGVPSAPANHRLGKGSRAIRNIAANPASKTPLSSNTETRCNLLISIISGLSAAVY